MTEGPVELWPNIGSYLQRTRNIQKNNVMVFVYRVSLSSLFILAIFAETLRSIVRSPISTTKPPLMSGLTCN